MGSSGPSPSPFSSCQHVHSNTLEKGTFNNSTHKNRHTCTCHHTLVSWLISSRNLISLPSRSSAYISRNVSPAFCSCVFVSFFVFARNLLQHCKSPSVQLYWEYLHVVTMSSRARGEQHEIMGEGYLRIIRTGVGVAFNSCLGCVRESCRHDLELVGPAVVVPDKDRCVCIRGYWYLGWWVWTWWWWWWWWWWWLGGYQ